MSWASFPPELVAKVLSDNELRKRDLANLARVNKTISSVVTKRLYGDVKMHGSGQRQDQEVLDLFYRTVAISPRLAATTQCLTINAFLPGDDKILRSQAILKKLNSLKNLSLAFHRVKKSDASFIQRIIPVDPDPKDAVLAQLQNIEITDPELTYHDISRLMLLPRLERLSVKCRGKQEVSGSIELPSPAKHHSLRTLTLGISAECNPGLQQILKFCPSLENFSCDVSSTHNVYDDPLSPAGLSRALMSCQETLVTMELNSNSTGNIDDSSLELSQFHSLRYLKASSLLLFEEDERDDPALRNGFYTRLPSSLENLEIYFATDTYAFLTLDDAFSHKELDDSGNSSTKIVANNAMWLAEIGQYRKNLSNVSIKEETVPSPSMRVQRTAVPHDAPVQIAQVFRDSQIEINLLLRPSFYPQLVRHSSP